MELSHPLLLLLLILLPLLYYGHRRSLVDLSPAQRWISLGVRTIIVILLILSLAGLKYIAKDTKLAVIFLMDASESISADGVKKGQAFIKDAVKYQRRNQKTSLLAFADGVRIISPFDKNLADIDLSTSLKEDSNPVGQDSSLPKPVGQAGSMPKRNDTSSTNIAKALDTAWGIFPTGYAKRLVLVSDGNETTGDALKATLRGQTHAETANPDTSEKTDQQPFDVQIYTHPLHPSNEPEVLVERIDSPTQVKQGEPFNLEFLIHSNHDDFAEVKLFRNKFEVAKQQVPIKTGENRINFNQTCSASGMFTYDAVCRTTEDTRYDNNHALGLIVVSGKPKVLLADGDDKELCAGFRWRHNDARRGKQFRLGRLL